MQNNFVPKKLLLLNWEEIIKLLKFMSSYLKKSKTAKAAAAFVGFAMALSFVFGGAVAPAQAQTVADLTAQINALLSTITALQAQLAALQGGGGGTSCTATFTENLKVGSTGSQVMALQKLLNSDATTQLGSSGAGSPGNETSYFGSITKAGVIKFQNKYASEVLAPVGLATGTGYWGPSSRAKANTLCTTTGGGGTTTGGGTTGGGTVTSGGGLTVSAGVQPTASLAPASAARVPFTRFVVTAGATDVTFTSVVVERQGLAADANFASVVLLDDQGLQIGNSKTLNSAHQATIGESTTVKAGTSKTFTVATNMAASGSLNNGELASFAVVGLNTSESVSGSLPIVGATHTINSTLTIGSVTSERGPSDPNSAVSKNVGTKGYIFSAIKVTAGSAEDVRIHSIRWNQASSAAASDLENVVTEVDGTQYPTEVSSNGKFYTSTFGSGIVVKKGNSVEVLVKSDIADGSARTIAFNIEKTTDLNVTGENFGYGITPPTNGTGFSAGSIWYAGKTVTINAGSLTVENAPSVPADNIAVNLGDQVLGGFNVEVRGEPVSVGQIVLTTSTTSTGIGVITNAVIVDQNGKILAGPVDGSALNNTMTFSTSITFPVGKFTYTVKGKTPSTWAADGTVQLATTPTSNWTTIKGENTGATITPSSAAVTMSTQTVKGPKITISVSNSPAAQTIVAGASQFTFANYQFDAGASGEDIRFSTIPLEFNTGSTATNLTQCKLYDGATAITTGSNIVDPSAAASSTTFTFDSPGLVVPKGTIKTLALKCNIASGATGTYSWGYDTTASPTGTGLTSGQSATIVEVDSAGQQMTLSAKGTLSVTLDSSSPSYTLAAAGTTGNTINILRFHGTAEDIRLQDVALVLTNNASSSASDLVKVTLWDGSTQIGDAIFTGTNTLATSTLSSTVTVPKDGYKLITVKADFSEQGLSKVGQPGAFVAVDWDASALIGTSGVGQSSGSTIEAGAAGGTDTAASGVRVYKAYPVFALLPLPTTKLTAGRADLFRFKITAVGPAESKVGIHKISFRIATSSATAQVDMIDNVNIYAYTDSGFSTAVSGLQGDGSMSQNNLDLTPSGTGLNTPWASASTDLAIYAQNSSAASTTVDIAAGSSVYFSIKGDVTTAGSTYSVSTQLQGDAKFASGASATGASLGTFLSTTSPIEAAGDNDFIWRPYSTTTDHSAVANDFSNAYGVPGLPAINTNVQTLTQ